MPFNTGNAIVREYLDDDSVVCGKVLRHENSGNDKSNRIWVYRNDHGEEYLAGDKYSCKRKAYRDLRLCRIDLLVEYTANMGVHSFEFSDIFQQHNMIDVLKKLAASRRSECFYEDLLKKECRKLAHLNAKLKAIHKILGSEYNAV